MSRLGKKPIAVPEKVEVQINGNIVKVKGPKGELSKKIVDRLNVKIEDNMIYVERTDDTKISNMNQGLMRSLINNMVIGVTEEYKKELVLEAREYRATMEGTDIVLNLGYSHPIKKTAPEGITFEVPDEKRVIVKGIDKELVGLVAANIKKLRKWEPYTSKGIKYKDEHVRKKERKTGV